jgi:energy-coupling factor transporter ATP-binding protein EcfA2
MATTAKHTGSEALSRILIWSKGLPLWQQDALRRVVEDGDVDADGIKQLACYCRAAHGLSEDSKSGPTPLSADRFPAGIGRSAVVAIQSISQATNVNALDSDQVLAFAPKGLTVVFGYNGSGKSGYGRILRHACRSRTKGAPILPNVLTSSNADPASAELTVCLDDIEQPPEQWIYGQRGVDVLGAVSFFDADCAAVHVRNKNDIAYIPFGLDVLPRLGQVIKRVQDLLTAERDQLRKQRPAFLNSAHATGQTEVGKLLKSLSEQTKSEQIDELASLNDAERARLTQLQSALANNPQKVARDLRAKAGRIKSLHELLTGAATALADDKLGEVRSLLTDLKAIRAASAIAAKTAFDDEPLPKVGEAAWRTLWEAARRYSAVAYPDRMFPLTEPTDAVCVLCQQSLDDDAKRRLERFEAFVQDDLASRLGETAATIDLARESVDALQLRAETIKAAIEETDSEIPDKRVKLRFLLAALLWRKRLVLRAIDNVTPNTLADVTVLPPCDLNALLALGSHLEALATKVLETADVQKHQEIEAEVAGLKAREWLGTVVGDVKKHLLRLIAAALLQECVNSAKTNRITQKSKQLSMELITDQLRDAFADEIGKVRSGVRRLNVELNAVSGEYGSTYYRVQLVAARDADIGAIVSEGEHRCIALAGFLSELATEGSRSAVVFDDPVTSLDHMWKRQFAERLVDVASERQVIVFTHDVTFLHDLDTLSTKHGRLATLRFIEARKESTGHVSDGIPWITHRVSERLDALEKKARASRQLFDDCKDEEYLREYEGIYSDLRAAVERTVEEVLLKGVIRRHDSYIRTPNLKYLSVITAQHCTELKKLFDLYCDPTSAHDTPMTLGFSPRSPDDILNDITALRQVIDHLKAEHQRIDDAIMQAAKRPK